MLRPRRTASPRCRKLECGRCRGDPLEIYTDKDGEVIFKKYSPIGELSDFAAQICESLHKSTDAIAAICDRDAVIAISGGARRELMDKRISAGLEHIMESRSTYRYDGSGRIPVSDSGRVRGEPHGAQGDKRDLGAGAA